MEEQKMSHEDVRAYYDSFGVKEWQRLERVDELYVGRKE